MTHYGDVQNTLKQTPRKWLVTGAAGFIGSALVETLLKLNQQVVGLDDFSTGHQANIAPFAASMEFIEGDICNLATCHRACSGVDLVLHQAALGSVPRSIEDPIASHRANVDGFLNILVAARDANVERFVYASSSSVYGDEPHLPKTEARIGAVLSPYAATKRIDEIYAGLFNDCYKQETAGLRYFNVFGPRQDPDGPYAAVIPRWILRMLTGEPCQIYGDGSSSRDFCYVNNAVQANLLAAVTPTGGAHRVYNVGCEDETDLNELHAMMGERVSKHRAGKPTEKPEYQEPRAGDIAHSLASTALISKHLGYQAEWDIARGMDETVRWFVERAR